MLDKNPKHGVAALAFAGERLRFTSPFQAVDSPSGQPQGSYAQTIGFGDLIVDRSSGTLFVADRIDGRDVAARIVTNWYRDAPTLPKQANAKTLLDPQDYLEVYPCSTFKTEFEFRGQVKANDNVIRDLSGPPGAPVSLTANFAVGDRLFFTDQLWRDNTPFPQLTTIKAIDDSARTLTMSQPAMVDVPHFTISMLG